MLDVSLPLDCATSGRSGVKVASKWPKSGAAASSAGSPGAGLVTIAGFVNAGRSDAALRRLERWHLQSVARRVLVPLGDDWRRLGNCCRARVSMHASIFIRTPPPGSKGSNFYSGLQHCGSAWVCPLCAAKIVEVRRRELDQGFKALRDQGGSWGFLTATFAHIKTDRFADLDARHAAALHHFRNSRAWKSLKGAGGIGGVRTFEVQWGPLNGFHPHDHMLLAFEGATPDGLHGLLYPAWSAALATVGLRCDPERFSVTAAYDAAASYVAKWGQEPLDRPWGIADEVTRGVAKRSKVGVHMGMFDLLRRLDATGESIYHDKFSEYATATKGRHALHWSPGLRARLGLGLAKTDEQIAQGIEQGAGTLGSIDEFWPLIMAKHNQGHLLEASNRAGWDGVLEFIGDLIKREGVRA